jgi:rhamnosyltransferase
MSEILISVVIPVKNGGKWLNDTLPAILNQIVAGEFEIIAVDSGSDDNSLSIIEKYPVELIKIPASEFNHGLTRNLGVQRAKGKYIVMTVQDAKPVSQYWFQQLLDGFISDVVAGVCGQQIVSSLPITNPVDWFRPISKPEVKICYYPVKKDFEKLTPLEQLMNCRWDNVNAMYRKDILMKLPFPRVDFAEDVLWAKDALMAGYAIVYNSSAQVAHYHHESYQFAYKRNFIVQYHFYKYFGVLPTVSQKGVFRLMNVIKILVKEKTISISDKLKWLVYNFRNQWAVYKSNKLLLKSVKESDITKLDMLYKEVCGSVPQSTLE